MTQKNHPFTRDQLEQIAAEYPTPVHIYDEQAIRENARKLIQAFDWVPGGYKNFFAVKAAPNPRLMQILHEEGMGFDCSSKPELMLCERIGVTGENIMFTSNDTPWSEYAKARELGAIINLDDISHIEYLAEHGGSLPELLCFRYNPGPNKTGNAFIGNPSEAKYGLTQEQIYAAFPRVANMGVRRFGLHTMVASNELNGDYFVETARMLFEIAARLYTESGIKLEFINLGGGVGIPYRPEEKPVDYQRVSAGIQAAYAETLGAAGLNDVKIYMENGRCITGPYGYLLSRVLHKKNIYKQYVGLDANMANLMRPGLYGAYHHISVPGKENQPADHVYDVTGSLCENNDKFAIDRSLPEIEIGDLVLIHDAGAHGHAMGFNYNGKLRSAELLLRPDNTVEMIRRAETEDDYFATLNF